MKEFLNEIFSLSRLAVFRLLAYKRTVCTSRSESFNLHSHKQPKQPITTTLHCSKFIQNAYLRSLHTTLHGFRFCNARQTNRLCSYRAIDRPSNPRGKSTLAVQTRTILTLRNNSGTQRPSTATGRTRTPGERWAPLKTLGGTPPAAATTATR